MNNRFLLHAPQDLSKCYTDFKKKSLHFFFSKAAKQPPQQTQRCRFLWILWLARPSHSRSSPVTPQRMSKLKSKTKRASYLTSRIWFLWANNWRMATLSQTIISRKSPHCAWFFSCGTSSSPLSTSWPRSTTETRWYAASVMPACIPMLSTRANRSMATLTNYTPKRRSNKSFCHFLGKQGSLLLKPFGFGASV